MIGFLVFLPTLVFVPHSIYLVAIVLAYYRSWRERGSEFLNPNFQLSYVNFSIIILIVIISIGNYIIGNGIELSLSEKPPSFILFPLTFLIAIVMRKSDLKILLILIFIEGLSVYVETALGISTFFSSLDRSREIGASDLLYYNARLGLSYNSSIVAAKLFMAFVLVDLFKMRFSFKIALQLFFIGAIFLTFNRTVFVAIFIYIFLTLLKKLVTQKFSLIKWNVNFGIGILVSLVLMVFVVMNLESIVNQLTRSTGTIELSGRDKIWSFYLDFIKEHIYFGNNGAKVYFGELHAHNSFIQVIATNGVIIAALYFLLIIRNINFQNGIFILTILSYCFFQYGIFWGISMMDIVFFYFLFKYKHDEELETSNINTLRSLS